MTADRGKDDATISIPVQDGAAPVDRLPSARGVIALRAPDGRTVAITATANCREAARRRLRSGEEGRSIDYTEITAQIDAYPVRSRFESELEELRLAREFMPRTYRHLFDRRQTWFLAVDPDADPPAVGRVPTHMLDEALAASPQMRLLGPIRDKHKANRGADAVVDLLDLCRYPRELARAPRGAACAYKEMGRCPAACDGSESMDAYRTRMLQIVDIVEDPGTWRATLDDQMREAASRQAFEEAGAMRRRAETGASLVDDAGRTWMVPLARLHVVVVVNIGTEDRVGVLHASAAGVRPMGELPLPEDAEAVSSMLGSLQRASVSETVGPFTRERADELALWCAWVYGTHRDTQFARIDGLGVDDLGAMAARVASPQEDEPDGDGPDLLTDV